MEFVKIYFRHAWNGLHSDGDKERAGYVEAVRTSSGRIYGSDAEEHA